VSTANIVDKVSEIVTRAGLAEAIEPVEVQLLGGGAKRVLRIYIDKPGGVTHADCQLISHAVSEALDADDIIPGPAYTLEVSSPGIERKLSTSRDFERHQGQKIKLVLHEPLDGRKLLDGMLTRFQGDVLTLQPERMGAPEGEPLQIPLASIKSANLKFEW
jgi:ribosome maturation factor RimP